MAAIVEHPDVQRMLLSMRALTAAARAICHAAAQAIDMSRVAPALRTARGWADRAALLTPIAKAFATDAAIDVANLGIQVHGGAGYIEETGAAQACAMRGCSPSTRAPTASRRSTSSPAS